MAASEARENTEMPEHVSTEPSLTEIREMLAKIKTSIGDISKENKSVKEELTELKSVYKDQKRKFESVKVLLESTKKENHLLREDLKQAKKLKRLNDEIDKLKQYMRKNSLEVHGVPEDARTSTEEVVLKLAEALDVHVLPDGIES